MEEDEIMAREMMQGDNIDDEDYAKELMKKGDEEARLRQLELDKKFAEE
jgi:hypothetical protein